MERRILVFAPSGQDAVLTERLFRSVDIDTGICRSDGELAAALAQGAGALLLAEEVLLGPAVELLRRFVAQQPAWSDLPVLLLTKHGADSLEAQRAVELLGNVTLLERPVRTIALISAARSALRARERQYQVRTLNQRKDEFLATLAHELRNPLAPIVNATAIFGHLHPSERTTTLVNMVNRQVSHLTRLIDDLMDVARITSGKIALQVAPTTVDAVLTQVLEIADGPVAERRHRLDVHRPQQDHALLGDHVRLVQSIANVLVNAAKFTPPGGEISLRVEVKGPEVSIRIRDNGEGLSAESIETIFGMFEQGRTVGEPTTGLGIGLHLSRVFVEMHGGSIAAQSDGPGHGSEFTLRLPIAVQAPPGSAAAPRPAEDEALPRHVLVADDNEDAALALQALLELHGIRVSVAHDGHQALELACATMPDAVVMDIGMPRMNGYEAARRMRELLGPDCPMLIALTGWGQAADRKQAENAGFDFHFTKPLDVGRLLQSLASYAEKHA